MMRWPSASSLSLAAVAGLLWDTASAQTWSNCNPLHSSDCPANTALGMTVNVDFTKGEVNSFVASGSPKYGSDGAEFTVARSGDAPQLASVFYIMFGKVEITMKAAPGAGMVSSLVLESDTLDEIDIEWLGHDADEFQSNYFGKGQTTTYNRGQFHKHDGVQSGFVTYTIDWTKDRIVWMAGGTVVRELKAADAEDNQYPQTPMQVKFGAWAGGDAATNEHGTVKWSKGPINFADGPFTMTVKSLVVSDYSTGKEYKYGDTSGTWGSIEAVDGAVNGNEDGSSVTITASAAGTTATGAGDVPVGGIARDGSPATATQTGWPWVAGADPSEGAIPSGWRFNDEGKIIRNASPALRIPHLAAVLGPLLAGVAVFLARLL